MHRDPAPDLPDLSRRRTLAMAALAPVAFGLPIPVGAAAAPARSLHEEIAAMRLPVQPARLELVRAEANRAGGAVRLQAVVRLSWAPGLRQHSFVVTAPDVDRARTEMVAAVWQRFAHMG